MIFIIRIVKKLMEDVFGINRKAKMKPKGSMMVLYSERSGSKVNQKIEMVKKMLEECDAEITKVVEHWQNVTVIEFEYDLETFEKKLKKIYENKIYCKHVPSNFFRYYYIHDNAYIGWNIN